MERERKRGSRRRLETRLPGLESLTQRLGHSALGPSKHPPQQFWEIFASFNSSSHYSSWASVSLAGFVDDMLLLLLTHLPPFSLVRFQSWIKILMLLILALPKTDQAFSPSGTTPESLAPSFCFVLFLTTPRLTQSLTWHEEPQFPHRGSLLYVVFCLCLQHPLLVWPAPFVSLRCWLTPWMDLVIWSPQLRKSLCLSHCLLKILSSGAIVQIVVMVVFLIKL